MQTCYMFSFATIWHLLARVLTYCNSEYEESTKPHSKLSKRTAEGYKPQTNHIKRQSYHYNSINAIKTHISLNALS